MKIIKTTGLLSDRGVPADYHLVSEIKSFRSPQEQYRYFAKIDSWSTLESMVGGQVAIVSEIILMQAEEYLQIVGPSMLDTCTESLILKEGTKYFNASILSVDVAATTLEEKRAAKWESIKVLRETYISTNLSTPYGVFQCGFTERQNISDAVVLAQTLTALAQPVSLDWTLADNSVVTLNATEIVNVGLLLGQKVQEAHSIARVLREAVSAATTIEEVAAVVWP